MTRAEAAAVIAMMRRLVYGPYHAALGAASENRQNCANAAAKCPNSLSQNHPSSVINTVQT